MIFLPILAVVLQQGVAPARIDPAHAGAAAVVDSLEAAEIRFFYEWRQLAKLSADAQVRSRLVTSMSPAERTSSFLRSGYIQCHPNTDSKWMAWVAPGHMIASASSIWVMCPSWALSNPLPYDSPRDADEAIDTQYRAAARQARESLITMFDSAARAWPGSSWIVGQRVRLLTDQGRDDRALSAARECRANAAWCAELAGYVHGLRGEVVAADSAFALALGAMPPQERCRWTDVSVLLDSADRGAYSSIPCAKRDSANAVFWWLSDPLYVDPGNERRVEQYVRQVSIALRSALDEDERLDWRLIAGGDALRELVSRYGWPSYVWPLWIFNLGNHGCPTNNCNASYATFEYSAGRLQTIPTWRAIADPLSAHSTDWAIGDPRQPVPRYSYANDSASRMLEQAAARVSIWWPRQHFAPRVSLVQLPDGQVAFLRRQTNVLLATATDLDSTTLSRSMAQPVNASLLLTDRPDSIIPVAHTVALVGAPVVLYAPIESHPTLAAIEFPAGGRSGPPGGRTRFGIAPPPPLSAMKDGELAISDVVLLRAPEQGSDLPVQTEQLLPRMAGSALVEKGARLGVYWETYGFVQSDTVEIAVWVERNTPQGIFRRFGAALNVATDLNTPVAISWTETALGPRAYVIPGPVPIIGRSIVLDASTLRPGEYWLDVVVRKQGQEPVRSRRSFIVPAQ